MSATNFGRVMAEVKRHEGGYVFNKKDPGGETNYGISKRSYPREDIKALTWQRACEIYRRDFWGRIHGDYLPDGFDLVTMDGAVNSGVKRGAGWLQAGLPVEADGRIGPATLKAAQRARNGVEVIQTACAHRLKFMRSLKIWPTFKAGWQKRVHRVEAVAMAMWLAAQGVPPGPRVQSEAVLAQDRSERHQRTVAGSGAAGAGGAGGAIATDAPWWFVAIVVCVSLVIVYVAWRKSRDERVRADVFREVLDEIRDEIRDRL